MPPDDSMGLTDDLVARLRTCLAQAKDTEPNVTMQTALEYRLAEAIDRITHLEQELAEALALNNKYAWERDKAREERDAVERRSEAFWKPQLTASQAEVERLRAALG